MKELNVSECLSIGWEYAKKHGLLVAVVYLVVSMLSQGLGHLFGPSVSYSEIQSMSEAIANGSTDALSQYSQLASASQGASCISAFVNIIVATGLYNFALNVMNGRVSTFEMSAFKLPFNTYLKYFAVEIIVGIICLIGTFLCVIPGIYLSLRLQFAGIVIIENPELGVVDAIKQSWEMTNGNVGSLFLLLIAAIGIVLLGFLCCCIGMYFAEAVILFVTVAAYNILKGNNTVELVG